MRWIFYPLMFFLSFAQLSKSKAEVILSRLPDNDSIEWAFKDTYQFRNIENLNAEGAFNLSLGQYPDSTWLYISSSQEFYLFCGNQLIKSSRNQKIHLRIGTLKLSSECLGHISVRPSEEDQLIEYGYYNVLNATNQAANILLESQERTINATYKNTFYFIFLATLIFLVSIKIGFQKRFEDVFSPTKIFTFRLNEAEQSRFRLFDQDNIIYSGLFTFITAAFIFLLFQETEYTLLGVYFKGVLGFLKLWIMLSVLLISKVILIFVCSHLFGNPKISAYYVKELLNINLFLLGILFFSSALIYLNQGGFPAYWLTILKVSFLLFFVIRLVLLYFKILKLSNFSKVYLFSYFCTTEIFPFIIGLKHFI